MKTINNGFALNQAEPDFIFSPPVIDILYNIEDNDLFPDSLRNSKVIKTDTKKRSELFQKLNDLFAHWQGLKKMDDSQLTEVYNLLTQFIEFESYNARILLYLPFELFSDISETFFDSELRTAVSNFRKLLKSKWLELLADHNIRADFFDGDIPEPEIRQRHLILVNKAAHLLPILLSNKLIQINELIALIEGADSILRSSLFDALFVAFDWGLISSYDLDSFSQSNDNWLRNFSAIIEGDRAFKLKSQLVFIDGEEDLAQLLQKSRDDIEAIDSSEDKIGYTQARIDWEKGRDQGLIIDRYSKILSTLLINGKLLLQDFLQATILSNEETKVLIGISSLNKMLTKVALVNLVDAQEKSWQFKDLLPSIYFGGSTKIRELIEQTYLHWQHLNIIDVKWLESIEVKPLSLDSLFSWNEDDFQPERADLTNFLRDIKEDSKLSNLIYPAFLLYGSKVKGYGLKEADIDLAVFVKPGTDPSEHQHIQFLLKKLTPTKLKVSSFLEFWLEENELSLNIKDWPNYDKTLANSWYSHVLFNGAFFGPKELIKKFYDEIIINYLFPNEDSKWQSELRRIWLSGLERDTLQYRLLHKGYEQIRPIFPLESNFVALVDGNSPFWDSGYRQLATQLFLKKVYLPQ